MMLKKLMVESLFFIRAAGGAGQKRTGSATLLLYVSFQSPVRITCYHVSSLSHVSCLPHVSCLLHVSRLLSGSRLLSTSRLSHVFRLSNVYLFLSHVSWLTSPVSRLLWLFFALLRFMYRKKYKFEPPRSAERR